MKNLVIGFLTFLGSIARSSPVAPTYQDVRDKIFLKYCNECHDPQNRIRFPDFQTTVRFIKQIEKQVLVVQNMPPRANGVLSAEEKSLLKSWIDNGTLDEYSNPPPAEVPVSETPNPTFRSIKWHIFELKCLPCHRQKQDALDIDLANYESLFTGSRPWVRPGLPSKSRLIEVIEREPGTGVMPPPDSAAPRLRPWERILIKQWIEGGAPL